MFAVTTRNKLRSRRHAINMIWAWGHVRRQLARTPGMLAYTTAIANPTEFFTLTLWHREIDMFLFMSSDAHRDMMWNFRAWTQSFWSMRWNATGGETGAWNGRTIDTRDDERQRAPAHVGPGYLDFGQTPERLKPLLRNITRPYHAEPLDFDAVIGRVPFRSPANLLRVRRALGPWSRKPGMERFVLATGLGDCLVLAVWKSGIAPAPTAELMADIVTHLPGSWAMRFVATDFETGHWDHRRFRDWDGVNASPSSPTASPEAAVRDPRASG